ncbi:MAG: hypothetical protein L3K16_04595 [Thermoplasmata archaeon]|nr:hypothetical protein [Thermoplasmata archaeon]
MILAVNDVPPFCTIPSGTTGRECLNGVRYTFESVPNPGPTTTNVSFAGDEFELIPVETNASFGVTVRGTEPSGASAELGLLACCAPPTPWQTRLSHDGQFGVQTPGLDLSEIRLLVRV